MDEQDKILRDLITKYHDHISRNPKPCTVCNKITRDSGIFFPYDSKKFGIVGEGQRTILYPMCRKCIKAKRTAEVEDRLEKESFTMRVFEARSEKYRPKEN